MAPQARYAARQRGALCTFHGHPVLVVLALSSFMGTDSTSFPQLLRFRIGPSCYFAYGVEPEGS